MAEALEGRQRGEAVIGESRAVFEVEGAKGGDACDGAAACVGHHAGVLQTQASQVRHARPAGKPLACTQIWMRSSGSATSALGRSCT